MDEFGGHPVAGEETDQETKRSVTWETGEVTVPIMQKRRDARARVSEAFLSSLLRSSARSGAAHARAQADQDAEERWNDRQSFSGAPDVGGDRSERLPLLRLCARQNGVVRRSHPVRHPCTGRRQPERISAGTGPRSVVCPALGRDRRQTGLSGAGTRS